MKDNDAKALMDRYFAGETTLKEERALGEYFSAGKVAGDLEGYAPLFIYWRQQRRVVAPAHRRKGSARRLPRLLVAIAAAALLLLIANVVHRDQQPAITNFPVAERQPVDWSRYEITDEQEALRFVKTVLSKTSDQLKWGPEIAIRELRGVEDILD